MLGPYESANDIVAGAATMARHGPQLLLAAPATIQSRCQEYWLASHERFQRWAAALKVHEAPYRLMHEDEQHQRWLRLHGLFEEILASEVFTRVWTAIGRDLGAEYEIESFVRIVYLNQLQTRKRALKLLLKETISYRQSAQLDKLRRRSERWTDLLLAHLAEHRPVEEYAFELSRVDDFAETLATGDNREVASTLLLNHSNYLWGAKHTLPAPTRCSTAASAGWTTTTNSTGPCARCGCRPWRPPTSRR